MIYWVWGQGERPLIDQLCDLQVYVFDMNRHTPSLIHIHQSSMIINKTMIELFDIRYAQNYISDEDVM